MEDANVDALNDFGLSLAAGWCRAASRNAWTESKQASLLATCSLEADAKLCSCRSLPRLKSCTRFHLFRSSRYKDGELNVGENSCIDRCSSKYWQARLSLAIKSAISYATTCTEVLQNIAMQESCHMQLQYLNDIP